MLLFSLLLLAALIRHLRHDLYVRVVSSSLALGMILFCFVISVITCAVVDLFYESSYCLKCSAMLCGAVGR
jgi:hypothetical protein